MLLNNGQLLEVGGGVVVKLGDTKWQITAEILEIDENDDTIRVRADGKEAWIWRSEGIKALSPGDYALDKAMNELDTKK